MSIYYIAGTGSDRNTGLSETTAFATFDKVREKLQAGDTLYVMNGTYTNPKPVSSIISIRNLQATAAQPTTIKVYPGHSPILEAHGNNWNAVSIVGSSYVVVEGLTMTGSRDEITLEQALALKEDRTNPATSGNGVQITFSDDPVTLERTHSTHITIRNNSVSKFPGGGISTSEADYITIENNVVSGNSYYSPYGTQGISHLRLWNSDSNTTDYKIIIQGNTVFDNEQKVPWFNGNGTITEGHGIMLDTASNRDLVGGVPYVGRTLIANNLVYNNGGSGINLFSGSNPVDVVNNTTYQNARVMTKSGEITFNYWQNGRAYNNILHARPDRVADTLNQSTNIIFDRNLIYNASGFRASDDLTLTGLQNILDRDPKFINAANGNFALRVGSPAIDAGTNIGAPETDRRGSLRDRLVDIGAFEAAAFPAAGTTVGTPGDDILLGTSKAELLTGGNGADVLIGALGADTLNGGAGGDRFVYSGPTQRAALLQSLVTSLDRIVDFSVVAGDRIQLDYDRNLGTVELPKRLWNAGKVSGKTLAVAVGGVYQDVDALKPGQQRLKRNEAVLFTWKNRTYLSVNDAASAFGASQDLVVAIAGISLGGTATAAGSLPIAQYFA